MSKFKVLAILTMSLSCISNLRSEETEFSLKAKDFEVFACNFFDNGEEEKGYDEFDLIAYDQYLDAMIQEDETNVFPVAYWGNFNPVLKEAVRMMDRDFKDEVLGNLIMAYLFYRLENVDGLKGVFERLDSTIEDRFNFSKGMPINIDLTKENNQIYTNHN